MGMFGGTFLNIDSVLDTLIKRLESAQARESSQDS
jgi:hypothetical protein